MRKVKRSSLYRSGDEVEPALSKFAKATYFDRTPTDAAYEELIIELHNGSFIVLIARGHAYCSASLDWDDVEIEEDDVKPTN